MDHEQAAGRLLALAIGVIKEKADGPSEGDYLISYVVEQAAKVCAEHGIDRALGWIDGYWYAAGNKEPGSHDTWRAVRAILGDPVR